MAKCAHCGRKKAKRACPALGSDLCPVCCGMLRVREVVCPPSCRHLAEHKTYQDHRLLEKKAPPPRRAKDDLLTDERLAWLALNIESALRELADRMSSFTDGDAVLGLEYAKEKLEKRRSLLVAPATVERKAGSDIGDLLYQSIERCRYERGLILADGQNAYKSEEKIQVLDRLIEAAKSTARGDFRGRSYLDRLAAQFSRMRDAAQQSKIFIPR